MFSMIEADVHVRILLAVAVIIMSSQLFGSAIRRIGQPRVCGEILAGIVLGPSVLGLFWPQGTHFLFSPGVISSLQVLAQLGLVMFMFLIGIDLDLPTLRGQSRKVVMISHASILLPVTLGALLSLWLYPRFGAGVDRLGFTLFVGAAMAITAFPVLARVLQETGRSHTRIGVLALSCAAVDDITAWCLLAAVVATVRATSFGGVATIMIESFAFIVVMLAAVRPLLRKLPTFPVWLGLALALGGAWVAEQIGIHAIFGAFMAGLVMPRRAALQREMWTKLETVTVTLLLPVFFIVVGLSTRIALLDSPYLWAVTALVTATAIAGKCGGSTLAARFTGEKWHDAVAVGILMNTRGMTELVILTVGLELRVITPTIFTMMVLMALVTTLMATPLFARVMRNRLPQDEAPAKAAPAPLARPDLIGWADKKSA